MRRNGIFLWILSLIALLAACVPASEAPRVEVQQLTQAVSYYPSQAGATWQYLPSGSSLADPRFTRRIEGPALIDGEVWVASRSEGLGLEIIEYKQYRPDGVYLLRRIRPGDEVTFDPPIRQFPAEGTLRVGASWSGQTTARIFFPGARPENQRTNVELEYLYTVVDQRSVNLQAGTFNVYVINFVTRTLDEDGGIADTLTQELWFTPNVGEIRTEQGFFLVATNTTATRP
jgi:hypothetical protein